MESPFLTLQVLAEAVKELPNPTAYWCTPRELILLCAYDWATIYTHLMRLAEDDLVQISPAETMQFSITQAGLEKAASLPTNLVSAGS